MGRRVLIVVLLFAGVILGPNLVLAQKKSKPAGDASAKLITPQAQKAIDAGLAYLAKNQAADGFWGTNQHQGNVAITSLGGLAFLAGGHQPGRGQHGDVLSKAIDYIVHQEDPTLPGYFHNPKASLHGPMYGQAFAVHFLAEAHAKIADRKKKDEVRKALERGVQLILKAQNAEGGWRYRPQPRDADISVTCCQLQALQRALQRGIMVPQKAIDKGLGYVKACQDQTNGGFRYQKVGPAGFARTAAGVAALECAGADKDEAVTKGLNYILKFKPGNQEQENREVRIHFYYGHYFAAQAMWMAGSRQRREWYPAIRDDLLRLAPAGDRNQEGYWFDNRICPHYSTAMALIILQIPKGHFLEKDRRHAP